jgi:1-acyl-sn-glycerol-3-phosphate acyltransferase
MRGAEMPVPPVLLRRAVTIPAVMVFMVLGVALLIVVTVATGPVSLCLRGRWRPVRLGSFLVVYLAAEIAALTGAFTIWVRCGPQSRRDARRYQELNFELIERFLARLYAAARHLFRLRVEILADPQAVREAAPGTAPRPVLILSRHAGPGDAFLLIYALLAYAGRRPLPVLKDTLALDPWIDVLFSRVPHCFIRPNPRAGDHAAAQISDLAAGMGQRDALVLFPEGGNFTPGRRLRAIGRLRRRGQPKRASQATRLEHVLPPRPAGVLAAIRAAPHADVAFVAHTGLDHMDSAATIWNGIPLDRPLQATWWRVPARNLPADQNARTQWLFAQWAQIDAWISRHRTARST